MLCKAKGYVRLSVWPFRFFPPQQTVEVVVCLRVGRHGGKRLYDVVDFHVLALAVMFPKPPAQQAPLPNLNLLNQTQDAGRS